MPELRFADGAGAHRVEQLHIDVAFDAGCAMPRHGADPTARFVAFARGPALRIIDDVFDQSALPDEVWRFDTVEIDLGRVEADTMEAQWSARLRDRLQELLLAAQQGIEGSGVSGVGAVGAAGAAAARRRTRRQSRSDALLHFLGHGQLPWYVKERDGDPAALAWAVLRDDAAALAAALRAVGDRAPLLRRLAGQFDGAWLGALVTALLPGEPAASARLLDAVAMAARSSHPAVDAAARADLWEAVLAQALAHGTGAPVPPRLSLVRAQLQVALHGGAPSSAADDPLVGTAPMWRRLLREDRGWLRATLRRLGRSGQLQRRLAAAMPAALLADVVGLWWAAEASDAVTRWIGGVAGATPQSARVARQQHLWAETLAQVLVEGDAGPPAVEAWRERLLPARPAGDGTLAARQRFSAALAAGRLQADPLLWQRVRDTDADWMRAALAGEVGAGESRRWRLARDWTDRMLLDAVALQAPAARDLVAALVSCPAGGGAGAAREPVWACTLRQLWSRRTGAFDGAAHVQALVRGLARSQHEDAAGVAERWHAASQRTDVALAWAQRIDALLPGDATIEGVVAKAAEPAHGGAAPAAAKARLPAAGGMPLAGPAGGTVGGDRPATGRSAGEGVPDGAWARVSARARDLAAQAGRALAAAVQALRRPWARQAAATSGTDAAPSALLAEPLRVDNAGLVLLAPYLPRLFEHLHLLEGATWRDAQAPGRAVHLLQFLADGSMASPECGLVLNKVLCGLEPAAPVPRDVGLLPAECAAAEGLLQAVVQHWRALGRTTIEGLRTTFLQRDATLSLRQDAAWQASVVAGPYDMLLDHLPWGYGMVKQPWMERMLHVEWR